MVKRIFCSGKRGEFDAECGRWKNDKTDSVFVGVTGVTGANSSGVTEVETSNGKIRRGERKMAWSVITELQVGGYENWVKMTFFLGSYSVIGSCVSRP